MQEPGYWEVEDSDGDVAQSAENDVRQPVVTDAVQVLAAGRAENPVKDLVLSPEEVAQLYELLCQNGPMRGRLRCLGTTAGIFGRLLYMLGLSMGNRMQRILLVLAIKNWKRVLDQVESIASEHPEGPQQVVP